jgi:hypothetical protein
MGGSYNFSLCFGGIISICTLSKAIGSHKTVNGMALEQTIAKAIKARFPCNHLGSVPKRREGRLGFKSREHRNLLLPKTDEYHGPKQYFCQDHFAAAFSLSWQGVRFCVVQFDRTGSAIVERTSRRS